MNNWDAVDAYLEDRLLEHDAVLGQALKAQEAAGAAAINVSPLQGKLLQILAMSVGARRILEVGTLTGYSAIWMARALPADGRLITLELNAENAAVARSNLAAAGLSPQVEVIVGPALAAMHALEGPFDLVFIDANKDQNTEYFQCALDITRPGGLIIVDNVVRSGNVTDAASADASVKGVRRFLDYVSAETRVTMTALQTVGAKGHDGFAIAIVN